MVDYDFMQLRKANFISRTWETLGRVRKPVITAVVGYALGGGCEVAMMS